MRGQAYRVIDHGAMIRDRTRMEAYQRALSRSITSDSVVLDVGAGSGILSFLACQLGARKVVAVEPDPIIELARELARENGFADRIEFIQAPLEKLPPDPRFDVAVFDLRGVLPLFPGCAEAAVRIRRDFLRPQGKMIPRRDHLIAAPVSCPDEYHRLSEPWRTGYAGLELKTGNERTLNQWYAAKSMPLQLLAPGQIWSTVEYGSPLLLHSRGQPSWTVEQDGILHGWKIWFQSELADQVTFSSGEGADSIYGWAFFPLREPWPLHRGEALSLDIRADWVSRDYVWTWRSALQSERGQLQQEQSTFFGNPSNPRSLRLRSASTRCRLSLDGELHLAVLRGLGQNLSLGEVSEQLLRDYADCFASELEALTLVGDVAVEYCE